MLVNTNFFTILAIHFDMKVIAYFGGGKQVTWF